MSLKFKKKFLAIITARKGSKGVKNKNLKKINNKPLIFYTFDFIKKNKIFNNALLTTNSDELINYSRKFPFIECPFKRPEHLSKDQSPQEDAILHALDWFEDKYNFTPSEEAKNDQEIYEDELRDHKCDHWYDALDDWQESVDVNNSDWKIVTDYDMNYDDLMSAISGVVDNLKTNKN